jgi:hypothetical protein
LIESTLKTAHAQYEFQVSSSKFKVRSFELQVESQYSHPDLKLETLNLKLQQTRDRAMNTQREIANILDFSSDRAFARIEQ